MFNIYTFDVPSTQSRKFIYADDMALAVQDKNLANTETILAEDLRKINMYFKKWGLQPNPSKTEVTSFH